MSDATKPVITGPGWYTYADGWARHIAGRDERGWYMRQGDAVRFGDDGRELSGYLNPMLRRIDTPLPPLPEEVRRFLDARYSSDILRAPQDFIRSLYPPPEPQFEWREEVDEDRNPKWVLYVGHVTTRVIYRRLRGDSLGWTWNGVFWSDSDLDAAKAAVEEAVRSERKERAT